MRKQAPFSKVSVKHVRAPSYPETSGQWFNARSGSKFGSNWREFMRKRQPTAVNATDIILESISDGVFTVDHDWHMTSFNGAAEEITGIPRGEAIGWRCCEVFRASMCEMECALRPLTAP